MVHVRCSSMYPKEAIRSEQRGWTKTQENSEIVDARKLCLPRAANKPIAKGKHGRNGSSSMLQHLSGSMPFVRNRGNE